MSGKKAISVFGNFLFFSLYALVSILLFSRFGDIINDVNIFSFFKITFCLFVCFYFYSRTTRIHTHTYVTYAYT